MYPSIIENLAHHAMTNPDKLCFADERKELTYKETWEAIYGLSEELKARGIRKDDCVVIECNQSADFMIFDLAIQLAGGIFVPLEKNVALARAEEIAGDTEAALFVGKKPLEGYDFMEIDEACSYAASPAALEDVAFPDINDVAEILFSTGTTGKSKGIVLTHRSNISIAENVCQGVKMKADNVEMIPMPTSHSHGLRRSYANLANGSSVIYIGKITLLKKLFSMMDQYGVTSMDLSPSMLSIIFKLSKDKIGEYADVMDYVQLGSAPLPEEDKQHLARLLPNTRLYNFYGSTEAGCSCLLDFNEAPGKKGCIGKPAVNSKFIVVDENRKEIQSSPDNLGFLASTGPINMKEYYKAPELTKEAMPDGDYIYTKDLGYIDENGYVYMLGRKDDVINYAGIKISPEELESLIVKNPLIKDCALVPVDDPLTGQAPKLYISLEDSTKDEYDVKAFKVFLSEIIDQNKQPKYIEIIDEIPRTFNGKIIRKNLIALNK
ncbi:MAG: acyl--CoA ligase [Clostridiales bacterium]|nr:acyl--CoA ligase [Candidatus Crickella merdequi]